MAIPQPEPADWLRANAQELAVTDRQVLALLRSTRKRVEEILADLPKGKQEVRRAQLESTRARLLAEQAELFERLGDVVSARRARAASRSARLSAASDAALLSLVGKGAQAQYLYDRALDVSQRSIDAALQRMKFSALPLSQRIYNTNVWMAGRLGKLINETLATGINAREFARRARDWFSPSTPGGVRYAALRLARTEINNAFHSMSAQKYAETPWIRDVEWNLSKSHPKPDECDAYAKASPYKSDETPARPHPQCMCYITPKSIEEDEFIDNFLKGDYDDYIDRKLEQEGWIEPERPESATEAGTTSKAPASEVRLPVLKAADGMPQGDGKPEFTSLDAAGVLEIGSEFLYHGDSRKEYRIIPKHVRVEGPRVGSGKNARALIDVQTGELVGQQASSSAKWWIEKIVKSVVEKVAAPLTFAEKRDLVDEFAFGGAGGSGTLGLNAALRGKDEITEAQRVLIRRMDRMFEEEPATNKVQTVYRIISGDPALRKEILALARKRGTFTDPGYMSTAKNKEATEDFAFGNDDVLIQIGIPAGAKVLEMDKYLSEDQFSQSEILLNRGSKLQFSSVDKLADGTWRVIASYAGSDPQPITG